MLAWFHGKREGEHCHGDPIYFNCSMTFDLNSTQANNWGNCDNETKAVGCGPQEIYRNCADISVLPGAGIRGSAGFNPRPRGPKAMKKYYKQNFKNVHMSHQHRRRL
ncbi:chitin-binding type-4 domain-containing protein [Trichonephila clavipes]|nr:chitin-binding type-4 domain-containing protein [Trichonephila clavipes]